MKRTSLLLLAAAVTLAAGAAFAGVESHSQYRQDGPTRYVVSVFEVIQDAGIVKAHKRTFKWKQTDLFAANESGVLPGEWYGPVVVDKSVDHVSWAGGYWRQDGAAEGNLYDVEVKEGKAVSPIQGSSYKVEVTFRIVKRPVLMQPNL